MPDVNPFTFLGIADVLLQPISRLIEAVLPDFIEENLRDEAVRERIVEQVDKLLIAQQPAAAAIPSGTRKRIIRGLLDLVLDEVVLT